MDMLYNVPKLLAILFILCKSEMEFAQIMACSNHSFPCQVGRD